MGNALKFFLNAIKAIFLSPFYIVYFLIFFIYTIFNHLIGEVRVLLTGFKYAAPSENKYRRALKKRLDSYQNGGE